MRAVERKLRERVKALESELDVVTRDRNGFRGDMVYLIKESISIHGEGKVWNMNFLIENLAKRIQQREFWWW